MTWVKIRARSPFLSSENPDGYTIHDTPSGRVELWFRRGSQPKYIGLFETLAEAKQEARRDAKHGPVGAPDLAARTEFMRMYKQNPTTALRKFATHPNVRIWKESAEHAGDMDLFPPRHADARRREADFEVVATDDGRQLYFGTSSSAALAAYDDHVGSGVMMLKNGRIVKERGPRRSRTW
jgi:hypothetical protein